jgi:hypothetical protein
MMLKNWFLEETTIVSKSVQGTFPEKKILLVINYFKTEV